MRLLLLLSLHIIQCNWVLEPLSDYESAAPKLELTCNRC